MPTTTSVHDAVMAALTGAGVAAVYGPAADLPTGADGLLAQAAVLYPAPRLNAYTRLEGNRSGGIDRVIIHCVGATTRDALAVADKVEQAIGGMVLSGKGGTLRQVLALAPEPEPDADPVRVSMAVEYTTVTKG